LTVKIEKKSLFAADSKNIFFPIFFKNILQVEVLWKQQYLQYGGHGGFIWEEMTLGSSHQMTSLISQSQNVRLQLAKYEKGNREFGQLNSADFCLCHSNMYYFVSFRSKVVFL